ncbi:translation initiation factor IF-2-like [Pyrgilauda ruficollis]|uniref:translation initiation factor IF-2-like n=1 Tax=Pyrgilauda ruficollis TaxID=221976 RepID=UPI001B870710|nr:translation initiation factor IF-2-like [Pyrgilauda ruficollis]
MGALWLQLLAPCPLSATSRLCGPEPRHRGICLPYPAYGEGSQRTEEPRKPLRKPRGGDESRAPAGQGSTARSFSPPPPPPPHRAPRSPGAAPRSPAATPSRCRSRYPVAPSETSGRGREPSPGGARKHRSLLLPAAATAASPRSALSRCRSALSRRHSLPVPLPVPGAAPSRRSALSGAAHAAASKQRAHVTRGRAGRERAPAPLRITRRPRGRRRRGRRRKRRHARAPARRPRDAVTRAAPPPSRRAGRGRGEAPPPQRGGAADPGAEQDGPPGPMAGDERGPRGRVTAGNGPGRARRGWGRGGGGGTVLLPRNCPLRPPPSWRRGSGRHVTGAGAGRGAGAT